MDISSIGNATLSGSQAPDRASSVAASSPPSSPPAAVTPVTNSAINPANKTPSVEQVAQAVKDINKSLQSASRSLEFTVDSDDKKIVVKVIDQQTREVLRQIPSEEAIEISKSLDKLQGLLIKQQA